MDLVLGADGEPQTLATLHARHQITEERLFGWYEDLAEALRYIREAGVVHRDVKPSNILIGEDGHAVLSDFGVSRFTDENLRKELSVDATMATDATTLSRVVMGTANYFAPEVRAGATATAAADIYALGVTLFRLLTGVWYEPDTNALELLKSFDSAWRRIFPALLAADPLRRSLPPCRRTRRLGLWIVLAVAVIAAVTVCACHFLHSGKLRVVSVRDGVVSVKEGVAPAKKDIPSEKTGGVTERSIDSIFFVP
jgi:serine/threonine protein kinase